MDEDQAPEPVTCSGSIRLPRPRLRPAGDVAEAEVPDDE